MKTKSSNVNYVNNLSARGWGDVKPHSHEERISSMKNHGDKCFLKPDKMKYPVCDKNGEYDCRGIIAAKFWADTNETRARKNKIKRKYSFKNISKKAMILGSKLGCKKFKTKKKFK